MALSKKDYETINTIMRTVVREETTPLQEELSAMKKELTDLKKSIKTLSKDNAKPETSKPAKPSKPSTSKTPATLQMKVENGSIIIKATDRIEGDAFKKVYELVKKYDGKIKNTPKVDGKKLACWRFDESKGKEFCKAIVNAKIKGITV